MTIIKNYEVKVSCWDVDTRTVRQELIRRGLTQLNRKYLEIEFVGRDLSFPLPMSFSTDVDDVISGIFI